MPFRPPFRTAPVTLSALALAVLLPACGRMSAPLAPRGGTNSEAPAAASFQRLVKRDAAGRAVRPGHVVLRLAPGARQDRVLARQGLAAVSALRIGETTWLLARSTRVPGALGLDRMIVPDPDVVSAAPHDAVWAPEADGEPMATDDGHGWRTASDYLAQPALAALRAAEAHAVSNGAGVRVAVLDTGLDPAHPAFAGAPVELGLDHSVDPPAPWTTETPDGVDEDGDGNVDEALGHGTHVASIVRLAAPGATVVAVKVLDADGWGTSYGVAAGIVEAVEQHGARVVNLSLGLVEHSPVLEDALRWAAERGVAVIASAGNRAREMGQCPAASPEALSVTAVDDTDVKAPFANWDATVDVSAPGVGIVGAIPAVLGLGDYATGSGCSMATPWMSGAVALQIAARPDLSPAAAAARVRDHGTPVDGINPAFAGRIGRGRVDLAAPLLAP